MTGPKTAEIDGWKVYIFNDMATAVELPESTGSQMLWFTGGRLESTRFRGCPTSVLEALRTLALNTAKGSTPDGE